MCVCVCVCVCVRDGTLQLRQSHLVTSVFYGFLFLCDWLLLCHIGFKAIGYRVDIHQNEGSSIMTCATHEHRYIG